MLLLLSSASAIACSTYSDALSINRALLKAHTFTVRMAASLSELALPALPSNATRDACVTAIVHWAKLLTRATMAYS